MFANTNYSQVRWPARSGNGHKACDWPRWPVNRDYGNSIQLQPQEGDIAVNEHQGTLRISTPAPEMVSDTTLDSLF